MTGHRRRLSLAIACLALSLDGCTSERYPRKANVEIKADAQTQADVFAATRSFGKDNGFTVMEGSLPKEGRSVSQILLKRNDGVLVTMDNFMDAGTLSAGFYAEKPQADWRSSEKAWEGAVVRVVGNRGVVKQVPAQ